jgi:hypothetical protein
MEGPRVRRECRAAYLERRVHARAVAGRRLRYYVQRWDPPSPLWRVPASGGAPEKVLDGVLLANFVVLEQGIYYIDRPSGQGASQMTDAPSVRHGFSTSISRAADPRLWLATSATCSLVHSRPLGTAARFSLAEWTPP